MISYDIIIPSLLLLQEIGFLSSLLAFWSNKLSIEHNSKLLGSTRSHMAVTWQSHGSHMASHLLHVHVQLSSEAIHIIIPWPTKLSHLKLSGPTKNGCSRAVAFSSSMCDTSACWLTVPPIYHPYCIGGVLPHQTGQLLPGYGDEVEGEAVTQHTCTASSTGQEETEGLSGELYVLSGSRVA